MTNLEMQNILIRYGENTVIPIPSSHGSYFVRAELLVEALKTGEEDAAWVLRVFNTDEGLNILESF